ncbi:MAG: lysylphosphatidylglycerol synthase transmembrane domain-containing protein, partial [Myxococcota bacterium]|nr:lysylphosphatidylglycerol synthase transmembrane domain-containing protein [Myxococcota bacterium]
MSATKMLKFGAKIAVSGGLIAFVLYRIGRQAEWGDLAGRLASLSAPWVALAFAAQLGAMCFTIWRWRLLLEGQEMDVPLRHLVGAFMIGRFIGTFTPSTIGLDGYRMYDMAKHSGLVVRSVSVILVEKIIGFFVLSLLVLATLPWGLGILPGSTLASIGALYSVPFILALVLLAKPTLIGRLLGLVFRPGTALGAKVEKAAAAVTTYEARRGKLVRAVLAGLPVHVLTIFIFVSTGMAIGAPISVTDMLFVGPLVITATVLPVSLSGLGVREAAYIFLLTRTGVTVGEAALLSFLGYLVGRAISLFGGLVWLARRSGYKVDIGGKAMQEAAMTREAEAQGQESKAEAETAGLGLIHGVQANSKLETRNSKLAFLSAGFGAGLLAGVAAGLIEMTYILIRVAPPRPWGDLGWAAAFYGVLCAVVGAAIALAAWAAARWGGRGRAWLRPSPGGLYAGIGLSIL